ncbi:MAG: helix-turn-helix transcriptional regulator [Chthoniobacteraceae bacterium]
MLLAGHPIYRSTIFLCRDGYALGWSQSAFAAKLQLAGLDIGRSGVSKIEARLRFVDDKDLMFLAEVLKFPVQELFPQRATNKRLSDFMAQLEITRFWLSRARFPLWRRS